MKSSGSTERDQDEGQGQGPASSQAEKMKNEEIRHTTSQTKKMTARQPRACEPNRRHGRAGGRGGSTSTRCKMRPQQGRQDRDTAELKLLQFPRPLNGRRSDTNTNTTSTTKTSSSTLPQAKREMQEKKKRMQVNQDMNGFCILVKLKSKTLNQEKVQMTILQHRKK